MKIRELLVWTLVILALPIMAFAQDVQAEKEWTFMVFLNGDNNLDSAGVDDMNEMEKVGSTDQVNIIAQHDRSGSSGTKRYFVKKDSSTSAITSPVIQEMPECDMGNWQEALKFFQWGVQNYPAKKYLFAIWNHGAGWEKRTRTARNVLLKGISYDDQSGNHITTPQLGLLLKAMSEQIGRKVDVIAYDACLMQMGEVGFEVKDYALVQVGAEETEPGDGWPYDDFLPPLVAKPSMDAREFGTIMVDKYNASYSNGSQGHANTCQSAVDLTKMPQFLEKLNAFADALAANAGQNAVILQVITSTQAYAYTQYKDLCDFTTKLLAKLDVPEIQTTGKALLKFVKEELVIKNGIAGSGMNGSYGLSLYFPTKSQYDSMRQKYAELNLSQKGKWDEFLQGLFYPNVPVLSIKEIDCEDDNGAVNPGDELTLTVKIANDGTQASKALTVSIESLSQNATVIGQPVTIDSVPGMGSVQAPGIKAKVADGCPVDTELTFKAKAVDEAGKVYTGEVKVRVKEAFLVKNKVLLVVVDKDDQFTGIYKKALADAGIAFDLYPISYYGAPSLGLYKNYVNGVVIFNAPGTNEIAQVKLADLASYLDRGGNLFITGQDIGYKIKDDPFYKNYLHATYVQDNTGIKEVVGQDVLASVTGMIEGGDGASNQKWPDEIDPIAPAVAVLKYKAAGKAFRAANPTERPPRGITGSGTAGVAVSTGIYKVVYFSFGFEGLASADLRKNVMATVVNYLKPTATDRIRGLSSLADQHRKLERSGGSAVHSSTQAQVQEWLDRSAPLIKGSDRNALKNHAYGRQLLRKVNYDDTVR
ncbi:MAG: hypothetical protein HY815_19765 [Candidatus Riflebacteria bacterium]|nr:hypothetical protein [Candidatus Riflebacteria bacterium]